MPALSFDAARSRKAANVSSTPNTIDFTLSFVKMPLSPCGQIQAQLLSRANCSFTYGWRLDDMSWPSVSGEVFTAWAGGSCNILQWLKV